MQSGAIIAEARRRAGLSRQQVAKVLQAGESTIAHYELGTRTPSMLVLSDLIRVLRLTASEVRHCVLAYSSDERGRELAARLDEVTPDLDPPTSPRARSAA